MAKGQNKKQNVRTHTARHYVRVVALAVFGMSLLALLMYEVYPYLNLRPITTENPSYSEPLVSKGAPDTEVYSLGRSLPTQLRIPKLFIDATFEEPLRLNADKTIEVPDSYEEVGWYEYGAAPGEVGTAVVLGHVDSYQGAAVFYHLGELTAGDHVFITREDGSEAEFEVEYLERYPQSDFPTEKVYGKTEYPSLRLITCSGKYVAGTQRYTHNLVVYARLVEGEEVRE